MTPLVSILVPCFNAERWLGPALDSAFAQTWQKCEIILVNDGSTDGSLAIAQRYESRGLRIATQPNHGQSAACNHALRLAQGEFIKFFDADDVLSPNMVALQIEALGTRPGCLAYSEWARFRSDPAEAVFTHRPGWRDAAPVDWLVESWAAAQPMMQCGQFLIPRALLNRAGGWDERLSLINDFEFFTRLTLASDGIVFTPGARLFYRSGLTGSVSRSRSARAWESAFLSSILATDYLVAAENSARTRHAAAAILQQLVFDIYPDQPTLVAELEARVAKLDGSALRPKGGRAFLLASRLVGWKTARRFQVLAGKRH